MKRSPNKSAATDKITADDILPEYDFSRAGPNTFAERYTAGSKVIVLDPDVAAVFATAEEANTALRALAAIIQKRRSRPAASYREPPRQR